MPRLARYYKKFERKFIKMKKKSVKKIISIIMVSALIFSVLTGVYATELGAVLGGIANIGGQSQSKISYTAGGGSGSNSGVSEIPIDSGDGIELLPNPDEAVEEQPGIGSTTEASLMQAAGYSNSVPRTVSEMSAEERAAYQAEKLGRLVTKYPDEYEYLSSISEIDGALYRPLLEMYDYWNITDFEEYAAAFVEDGFAGLNDFHTERRVTPDNAGNGGGSGE
jgi:hypothetical protein